MTPCWCFPHEVAWDDHLLIDKLRGRSHRRRRSVVALVLVNEWLEVIENGAEMMSSIHNDAGRGSRRNGGLIGQSHNRRSNDGALGSNIAGGQWYICYRGVC